MIRPRTLPFSRWWLRPSVYSLVAILASGGGYSVQAALGRATNAAQTFSSNRVILQNYLAAAKTYRTLRDTIIAAKAAGIDTTVQEASLAAIKNLLDAGSYSRVITETTIANAALTLQLGVVQAAQLAAAEEAKKYGTLALTVSNGAGAAVSATLAGQSTTGAADDQGLVSLKLLVGTYSVTITRDAYQPITLDNVTIASLQTTSQQASLTPVPVSTPTPVQVPAPTPTPKAPPTPKPIGIITTPASDSTAHSSYRRTTVTSSRGSFTTDIMEFELGPGKIQVITDTADDNDCANNCSALSAKGYADRHAGAVAAINGTYFCPPDYSSCSDQINNFFWKIKNPRIEKMINATDGLGENDGFMTFSSTGIPTYYSRWIDAPSSVFAGINHKPTVVTNGSYSVDESTLDDKQLTAKISRAAIGVKGNHLTMALVQSATIMDLGSVMVSLGVDTALNIDAGGSTGWWYNGSYKRGPGRAVPNALVFVEQ